MENIFYEGKDYSIKEETLIRHEKLCQLILDSPSMTYEEKQYWFDILHTMTKEQIERLDEILKNEKERLEELDKRYEEELKALLKRHLDEWIEYRIKLNKS